MFNRIDSLLRYVKNCIIKIIPKFIKPLIINWFEIGNHIEHG